MEKENDKEALFRKFIANRCSPEEIEQVLAYLKLHENAKSLIYPLITQEFQQTASSGSRIDPEISEGIRRRIFEQIANGGPSMPLTATIPQARARSTGRFFWGIAAAFAGILLLAGAAYRLLIYKPMVTHATVYGEIATIVLPDSSTVVLNGNSQISFGREWDQGVREVWIEGEAFFSVRHTHDDRKLVVHSSEQLDVEVLGTEFNVYDRPHATRVVLNSGKVKLNIRKDNETPRQVDMRPGELVELDENLKYEKRDVNPELYTSWITGKVVLDNTSFREIALLLEETYGLSVTVPDTALYNERFSGAVPSENVEALLKALALSFNLSIKTNGNNVTFNVK
ncbi:FecR family protein [Anseongella ginsenosidimutans]|uniref:FecR family protein n=1 Tax=Anseongella ginsenosidimutans TaxID=496056 RepID=UPI0013155E1B|nr:FecR domain-containing protein [Anseongella ginsenosidimutans]